jgi:excisionase family DNA binding protein
MPRKEVSLPGSIKWLSLQGASRMLGVHPSTLRQWADAGKIHTVRTPGGHRRFAESDVRALLEPESVEPSSIQMLVQGVIGHSRMDVSGGKLDQQPWYERFDETGKAEYRELSRKLLALLVQYLTQPMERPMLLDEVRIFGRNLADRAMLGRLTLSEAAGAVLYLQDFLMDGIIQMSRTAGHGVSFDLTAVYPHINLLVKDLLLTVIYAYERR